MVFFKSADLVPGMCLARDITFFDSSVGSVVTLKTGSKLTDMNITQMLRSNVVAGVFIDSKNSEVRVIASINSEIKKNAISNIHTLADNFMDSDKGVTESDIDAIGNTTEQLIDELSGKKDILINIADLKMYDDYTYHHSLSVAIMSIAIGLEMGLSRSQLDDLGIAGLLHDIGKVPTFTVDETGRGHFYGHAQVSAAMADRVLLRLKAPTQLRQDVCLLIRQHMTPLTPDKKLFRGIGGHNTGFDPSDGLLVKFTHNKIKLLNDFDNS